MFGQLLANKNKITTVFNSDSAIRVRHLNTAWSEPWSGTAGEVTAVATAKHACTGPEGPLRVRDAASSTRRDDSSSSGCHPVAAASSTGTAVGNSSRYAYVLRSTTILRQAKPPTHRDDEGSQVVEWNKQGFVQTRRPRIISSCTCGKHGHGGRYVRT
jgi:hypothetical protein